MKKRFVIWMLVVCAMMLCAAAANADSVIMNADIQKDGPVGSSFTIRPEEIMVASVDGSFTIELTRKPFTPPAGMAPPAAAEKDDKNAQGGFPADFAPSTGESAPEQLTIYSIEYLADGSIVLNTENYSTDNNFTISLISSENQEVLHQWTEADLAEIKYGAIDSFTTGVYEGSYEDKNGQTVPLSIVYALYVPEQADENTPMVVTMHGSGESGNDGLAHLTANQLNSCWVEEVWQKEHPCYVLAPQFPDSAISNDLELRDSYLKVYHDMLEAFKQTYRPSSVYLASLSMGSRLGFRYLTLYPNYFDAAIMCCGALQNADPSEITEMPVWFVHAISDGTNLSQNSADAFNQAVAAGNTQARLTLIPDEGLDGAGAHFAAWQIAYSDNSAYMNWLFEQK